MGRELNAFVGRNVITMPLDTNKNVVKMDELDNTDNLDSILLRF